MAEDDNIVDTADMFDPEDRAKAEDKRTSRQSFVETEALAFLAGTQEAYKRVFHQSHDAYRVLQDLQRFCRANETVFDADPRVHALLCGRQEVWLRINEYVNMSFSDLTERRTRRPEVLT